MKRILVLAAVVSAFVSAPPFAKGQGIGIGANVLTGRGGVIGLLDGRGALVVNTSVTTGKNGRARRGARPQPCFGRTAWRRMRLPLG